MPAIRVARSLAVAALALSTLAACGAGPVGVAAPRAAEGLAARAADATPRAVAKLLDKDGDGLIVELEGWVSGNADGEAFANFAVLGRPGKPVPTATVERALTTRGEVVVYGMAGGTGPDGQGVAMTESAIGRLAQGLATALAADPLSVGGRVPTRVTKIRHYAFRDNQDTMESLKVGALASAMRDLLEKPGALMRVKLVAGATFEGKKHRVVLTDHTTF